MPARVGRLPWVVMARGQTTSRPGVLAARPRPRNNAPAAASGPWADPELPTDIDSLKGLLRESAASWLRQEADDALARIAPVFENPDVGASEPGQRPNRPANDAILAAAALHAADPNDPRIEPILRDLVALQRHHLAAFAAATRGRVFDWGSAIAGFYVLPSTNYRGSRDQVILDLQVLCEHAERYLDGERPDDHVLAVARRQALRRSQRAALATTLRRMLIAEADPELVRALISASIDITGQPMRDFTPQRWADIVGYARAATINAAPHDLIALLTSPSPDPAVFAAINEAHIVAGDASPTHHSWGHNRRVLTCTNLDDALTRAHALLRDPAGLGALPNAPDGTGLVANVPVDAATFTQVIDRFSDEPTWGGVGAYTQTPDAFGEPEAGDPRKPPARHVSVGASAQIRARIDNREVAVRFMLMLDHTTARAEHRRVEVIRTHLHEQVGRHVPLRPGADGSVDLVEVGASPVTRIRADRMAPGAPTLTGRAQLLGPERCAHEGANWIRTSAHALDLPYLRLSCSRCLRHHVATAPAHCAPSAARSAQIRRGEYVRNYRAFRAFHGHREPEDLTIDALRERDRHISLDPRDYATEPAPERRRAPARPGVLGATHRR